jgi:hypothetical protein
MSVFVTDKRIESLTYDLICTRKDLKEMTLLVQTNSTTIADLLALIRDQNKWLTELRTDVDSLKSELSVLKKGSGVVEKVEVSLESKITVEEEIKPEDKPFRHFEFDKSWEQLPAVKEWGDLNVVQKIEPANSGITAHWGSLFHFDLDKRPISIKEYIKKLEKHLNTQPSLQSLQSLLMKKLGYKSLSDFVPDSVMALYKRNLHDHVEKKTILGYFLGGNNSINYLNFNEKNLTLSFQLL